MGLDLWLEVAATLERRAAAAAAAAAGGPRFVDVFHLVNLLRDVTVPMA